MTRWLIIYLALQVPLGIVVGRFIHKGTSGMRKHDQHDNEDYRLPHMLPAQPKLHWTHWDTLGVMLLVVLVLYALFVENING